MAGPHLDLQGVQPGRAGHQGGIVRIQRDGSCQHRGVLHRARIPGLRVPRLARERLTAGIKSGVAALPIGPVFRWETAAIARRKRTYVIRGIFGLVILTCFSLPLLETTGISSARELEHRQLAAAAQESFGAILAGQALALLLVTPALFAGAIAQEVERGNLTLLLASPASSLEIVLGKLGPRIAQVVLILAVAVPVLGLLSLNGGVDDKLVILSDAVLLTSAFLIASAAMLISVVSDNLRQAVLWTYVAEILWLAAPALFGGIAAYATPTASAWAELIARHCAMTSPFSILTELNTLPPTIVGDFLRTMLVQLGLGAVLVAVAASLLRPVARGAGPFGWRLAPVSFLLSRRRLLPRPACGERPVLWKEMHVARSRVLARLFLTLVVLAVLVPLGWVTWNMAVPAFHEVGAAGYGSVNPTGAREEFNMFLRATLVSVYMLLAIGLAVFCATCITSEKEKATWTSLIATPLSALEIVGQKMIGACWRLLWLGLIYLVLLTVGVAAGAIHPLGGFLSVVQIVVFLGFVAGLGTWMSLRSKSSVHALGWTFFVLFVINGGYLLGCVLVPNTPELIFFLVTPLLHGLSLATYPEVNWFLKGGRGFGNPADDASLIMGNLLFYGVSMVVLCYKCVGAFEQAAGRPCRDRGESGNLYRSGVSRVFK